MKVAEGNRAPVVVLVLGVTLNPTPRSPSCNKIKYENGSKTSEIICREIRKFKIEKNEKNEKN
jgi:hypothetical protein